MKLADILVELQVMGCQILSSDTETETFQDVEFHIGQTTDLRAMIKMLRKYNFFNLQIDTKDEDVITATRFVYNDESFF